MTLPTVVTNGSGINPVIQIKIIRKYLEYPEIWGQETTALIERWQAVHHVNSRSASTPSSGQKLKLYSSLGGKVLNLILKLNRPNSVLVNLHSSSWNTNVKIDCMFLFWPIVYFGILEYDQRSSGLLHGQFRCCMIRFCNQIPFEANQWQIVFKFRSKHSLLTKGHIFQWYFHGDLIGFCNDSQEDCQKWGNEIFLRGLKLLDPIDGKQLKMMLVCRRTFPKYKSTVSSLRNHLLSPSNS